MIINEIFYSIQGEGPDSGLPTIFIRLTGCNLRCAYCDTKYAYHKGKEISISKILQEIKKYPCNNICLTGGEPLLSKKLPILIKKLHTKNYTISIETNGSLPINQLPKAAKVILDLKTPCSKMQQKNLLKNLKYLRKKDALKIVTNDINDLKFAQKTIENHNKKNSPIKCPIIISPMWESKSREKIVGWLLKNPMPNTRIAIQLHKVFNFK